MSVVAKRSPISATAELLLFYSVIEPRAAIKIFLGWATDGSGTDIKIFKRFLF